MSATNTVALLSKHGKGAKFASFTYTAKGSGEVAKCVMILGAHVETLYRKDLERLRRMERLLKALGAKAITLDAVAKVVASREKSLTEGIGQRSDYTNRDTYEHIGNGLRVHRETGEVYVAGLMHQKTVVMPGVHKAVKSKPETIVKNKVERMLPSSRFRTLCLGTVTRVAANGDTVEL